MFALAARREIALGAGHEAAGVEGVEEEEGEQHGEGVERVLIGLVQGDGRLEALRVLDEAEDDADGDGEHNGINHGEEDHGAGLALRGGLAQQQEVELDDQAGEDEHEELLDADAAHVDVDAAQDLVIGEVRFRGRGRPEQLHQEGENVQQHEVEPEAPGFDLREPRVRSEVEDHAPEDHVDVRVDPERRHEQQDEVDHVGSVGGRVLDRDHPEEVGARLPEGGHGHHPAVAFPVDDALGDVGGEGDDEEDGEDVGGGDVRAEFPDRVVVIVRDVAMRSGYIMDRHL